MDSLKLFVVAKACIINVHNEILLIRESNDYIGGTNTAKYDVPGGKIQPSETLVEGLKREVREEIGLSVRTYELLDVHDTFNRKGDEVWHIVRLFYKVTCDDGEVVLSKDHDKFAWVKLQEVKSFPDVIQNLLPTFEKLSKIP